MAEAIAPPQSGEIPTETTVAEISGDRDTYLVQRVPVSDRWGDITGRMAIAQKIPNPVGDSLTYRKQTEQTLS
ncbi:hypothetical protein [Phormidium sp. CCY1219]|uniref:hypothetical protein n=1 Tax=Phormidium sp. CCY1219 TaxID=2886104 RepID=UPI002D1E8A2B|nr:hypothetical protein [Phormidium sp. CCY1219]MEB3826067.1 hypothetical protein [Phormidium sp. CCY1219]